MYLILHKVRGEPAFDIAEKFQCPECSEGCEECDSYGYWWICSTSGHRARPYKWWPMENMACHYHGTEVMIEREDPPPQWPDHFPLNKAPKETIASALAVLMKHLPPPPPPQKFHRRI